MHHDSNHAPRFPRRPRPFASFKVATVERVEDAELKVRGDLNGREVEVRVLETSGEFRLTSQDGEQELTRSDLRDLGPALMQYQKSVPWVDSVTGHLLKAVNDAIFPTTLADFALRSASDLGSLLLLTGRTAREEIDVVLDTSRGELSILVTRQGKKAARRPITSQEAWDLAGVLRARLEGQRVTPQTSLLATFVEALRRQAHH